MPVVKGTRASLLHLPRLDEALSAVLCPHGRPQVDGKGQHVESEDEGDNPLEDGGRVAIACPRRGSECDAEEELGEDEGELDPEGDCEDAVLAVLDAEALVLCADEDGGDPVAADEEQEEDVVELVMPPGVEDGQQDEAAGTDDGEEDGEAHEDEFADAAVGCESASLSEDELGGEGQVEEDGANGAHCDEHGFEFLGANV